jgi:hypothetical protein
VLKGPPDIFIEITYFKSSGQREEENNFCLIKKITFMSEEMVLSAENIEFLT